MTLPPESGPILLALAAHWDLAQPLLIDALLLIVLGALSFAAAAWIATGEGLPDD